KEKEFEMYYSRPIYAFSETVLNCSTASITPPLKPVSIARLPQPKKDNQARDVLCKGSTSIFNGFKMSSYMVILLLVFQT
ncbi:hypothetical protein ACH5RR_013449, partial [Cinchona calisaya]